MADNVLKKQFHKKDVSRLRNLVAGKYGEKTTVGIGYSKKYEAHNEGDIWTEDGRQWTIKNGVKQNITKLDAIKEKHILPLLCPKCSKLMATHRDKPFYNVHKMCLNCVIDFEAKLRSEGKWEEYEKTVHNNEINGLIAEFTAWTYDNLKTKNESYITENGDVERWVGGVTKEQVEQNLQESIKFLEALKK